MSPVSQNPEPEPSSTRAELIEIVARDPISAGGDEVWATDLVDARDAEVRAAALADAVEAARGEYLHDDTGTPEDEAYQQGVADAIAAIGRLIEPEVHCGRQKPHEAHGGGDDSYRCPGTSAAQSLPADVRLAFDTAVDARRQFSEATTGDGRRAAFNLLKAANVTLRDFGGDQLVNEATQAGRALRDDEARAAAQSGGAR